MASFSNCFFEFTITCPPGYISPQQAVERLIAIGWVEPVVEYMSHNGTWMCSNRGGYGALTVMCRTFNISSRGYSGTGDGFLRFVDEYSLEAEIKHYQDSVASEAADKAYRKVCDALFHYPSGKDSNSCR